MIAPTSNLTYEGKPLSVLESLIEKRQKLLGETVKESVIATAITVVKSLRAATKIAPEKAPEGSYLITDTGYVGSWERKAGKLHRVARMSSNPKSPKVANIYPVNLAGQKYEKNEIVKVYKITPKFADGMKWEKTKHKGCWYVFAKSMKVAQDFAERHITRRIDRYRGLAKSTLGFAMAAVSNRGNYAAEVKTSKAVKAAQAAVHLTKDESDGKFVIRFIDLLNYSALALKGGSAYIQTAMKKAANAIAARLSKVAGAKLNQRIPTPFPETKGG